MTQTKESRSVKVAVVLLNWNGCSDTLECLSSIYQQNFSDFVVYVADNGSSDQSTIVIPSAFPKCRFLKFGRNFGFAEGNNKAIEQAIAHGCEFVLLLNNDTIIAEDFIGQLEQASRSLPALSVLGAKIGYYDRRDKIWDFGSLWDGYRGLYCKVATGKPIDSVKQRVQLDHISGCAMWIPVSVIKKIGLFDTRFFLNYEETDWCTRAKRAGVGLYGIPQALMWHKISASFEGKLHNYYFCMRNNSLWRSKHFSYRERFKWWWCSGAPSTICARFLRLALRILTAPLWLPLPGWRKIQSLKIMKEVITFVAIWHHLISRYGDCPDWIKSVARKLSLPS